MNHIFDTTNNYRYVLWEVYLPTENMFPKWSRPIRACPIGPGAHFGPAQIGTRFLRGGTPLRMRNYIIRSRFSFSRASLFLVAFAVACGTVIAFASLVIPSGSWLCLPVLTNLLSGFLFVNLNFQGFGTHF